MNKEEMKAKMAELNEKMKGLGSKVKDGADTAYLMGLEAKDKIYDAMQEAKSGVNAMKENYQIYSQRVKGKASTELLKAQMNIDAAKKELEARKEAYNKEKLEEYIQDTMEYAESCVMLAELATKEAEAAKLEVVKAQKEYEEKYGEK